MRYTIYFFLLGMLLAPQVQAQAVVDTISIGAGYARQTWYSLDNGEVATQNASDWDLAFEASGFGSGIRINGGVGHLLYKYTAGDTSHWNNLDSTSQWMALYDSDTSWSMGAFNQTTDGNFDLGWGNYSVITHAVTGDSIYILESMSGMQKKIWIQSLASGVYTFKYADLDGSNEMTVSLDKATFSGQNFGYFNLGTGQALSHEPASADWDFVFGRYIAELFPGTYYGVSGVLSNHGMEIAEVQAVDPNTTQWSGQTFSSWINTIGYDWKDYNFQGGVWDITDSLVYFAQTANGNIWKMVFTEFGGSSNGNFIFSSERLSVDVNEPGNPVHSFTVFPNPTADRQLQVLTDLDRGIGESQLRVLDLSGKVVRNFDLGTLAPGLKQMPLNLEGLSRGMYLVQLQSNAGTEIEKIILQ